MLVVRGSYSWIKIEKRVCLKSTIIKTGATWLQVCLKANLWYILSLDELSYLTKTFHLWWRFCHSCCFAGYICSSSWKADPAAPLPTISPKKSSEFMAKELKRGAGFLNNSVGLVNYGRDGQFGNKFRLSFLIFIFSAILYISLIMYIEKAVRFLKNFTINSIVPEQCSSQFAVSDL